METTIRRRLASDGELCGMLAKFFSEPAIYYQKAPADTDTVGGMYPHLILTVDKFYDAQKGVAGALTVEIVCSQDKTAPEEIERLVRKRLEGVFFKPDDGEIFSLKWQRTDVFSEPASERTPLIIGAVATFDLYEWPLAETSTPDPVQALNIWAQRFDVAIIGVTEFDEVFEPTHERPAVYFDVQRTRLTDQKSTAVFCDVTVNMHVFAPNVRSRREWLASLNQDMLLCGTIPMDDLSPMRLQEAEYLWAASEVDGQIQYRFSYGILRPANYAHPISFRNESHDSKVKYLRR